MNVLFLSPNFPPHYGHFCRALAERGARVLGVGDALPSDLDADLRLTDYVHVADLGRYDDVLRAVGLLVSRHGRIQHVDSLNEHWLPLEAMLREDFNVPGPRPAAIAKARSKSEMARAFAASGIPAPRGVRVHSAEELRHAAMETGYPIVFKPDVGVGASGAVEVRGDADLEGLLASGVSEGVVQELVSGTVVSFDGLCDRDGRIVYFTAFRNCAGVLEIVRDQLDVYYYTLRDIPPELERLGRAMVGAFDLRGSFFHAELFERPDGRYVALEINLRPAGGFSTDLMNYASDIDVYRLWADVVVGRDVSGFSYERTYHAAHASRRPRAYALDHDAVLRALGPALMKHGELPPAIAHAMGSPVYLIRHDSEIELLRLIRAVHQHAEAPAGR